MTEGGGVALLLQVEAMGADTARRHRRQAQLEVNHGLRLPQSWDVQIRHHSADSILHELVPTIMAVPPGNQRDNTAKAGSGRHPNQRH